MEIEKSLYRLLPHRPPAMLVTEVAHYTDHEICCIGRIPEDHPAVWNGFAPATMAVEFGAQSAGMLMGLLRLSTDPDSPPPEAGYLVSLKDVQFGTVALPAQKQIRATAQLKAGFGNLALFSVTVELDGDHVMKGHLGIAAP